MPRMEKMDWYIRVWALIGRIPVECQGWRRWEERQRQPSSLGLHSSRTKIKQPEAEFKEFERRLKLVFNVSRFKPALNWNRFLTDLRRGSNSLNSDTDYNFQAKIRFYICQNICQHWDIDIDNTHIFLSTLLEALVFGFTSTTLLFCSSRHFYFKNAV